MKQVSAKLKLDLEPFVINSLDRLIPTWADWTDWSATRNLVSSFVAFFFADKSEPSLH